MASKPEWKFHGKPCLKHVADQPPDYDLKPYAHIYGRDASYDTEITDRLRRFLLFRLLVDYGITDRIPQRDKLKRYDWLLFLELAGRLAGCHSWYYSPSEMIPRDLGVFIHTNLVLPAEALRIPYDVAAALIRAYPATLTRFGGHKTMLQRSIQDRGYPAFAARLLIDSHIMFRALTDNTAIYEALCQANLEIRLRFFLDIRTPKDYDLTPYGKSQRAPQCQHGNRRAMIDEGLELKAIFKSRICVPILRRLFMALPAEGEAKEKPGWLEKWTRAKAKVILGRDD